jgi:hypothetical protein
MLDSDVDRVCSAITEALKSNLQPAT